VIPQMMKAMGGTGGVGGLAIDSIGKSLKKK
jgi:hypothetical protein